MINACINLLSARTKCLPECLKSLWDHWNYRYNYPVYVHYFDDIYDDPLLQKEILEYSNGAIEFRSIPYEIPADIPDQELFYNRKDLWYVNSGQFTAARKGFLHMNKFFNNLYGYPNTEFEKYDYMLSIDDEAIFLKEVPYDFFEVIKERPEPCGAIKVTYPHLRKPHQGNFDTRVGMIEFVLDHIKQNNLEPKCGFIKELCQPKSANDLFNFFHSNLTVADSWVFKTSMFTTPEWKQWSNAVNKSGGIYRYRWGDCELNYLFLLIYYGEGPYDFKTVDEGYHDQGGLRHIQNYAPSVKN